MTRTEELESRIRSLESCVVAFSGGVDSSLVAALAARALGERALAVTAVSAALATGELDGARDVAREIGIRHETITTAELEREGYRRNDRDRCYHCKTELYSHLSIVAKDRGVSVIVDGNNADDRGDYRPGRQAAREFGVRSPLDEADLTKAEIRELSREAGLPTWDEPASACLSSRIPYMSEVTEPKLQMIERAEDVLRELGFRICRVRHHDTLARLEIGRDEMARALDPEVNARIVRELKAVGFKYVSLDLQGYRTGSLNEALILTPA